MKKLTTESFIQRAKKIHGDKYNYSKVEYKDNKTKVCIICPIHGEFLQKPNSHLNGCGCRECGIDKSSRNQNFTTEEFIEKARKIHGDKYDYSKVEYTNNYTLVCIICPKHGETWQKPCKHLGNKYGCYKCSVEERVKNRKLSINEFIEKAKQVHGDKYDYSKVKYSNNRTKVTIICPIHGEFKQTLNDHLRTFGCPKCANKHRAETKTKTTDKIIELFKKRHGNKYDYSKVEYKGIFDKVRIICPIHGEFLQSPDNHIHGKGCPTCNESKLEESIRNKLQENGIEYESQKKFSWLIDLKQLKLDFYLPKYNVAIECQGIQHFESAENGIDGWFDGTKDKNVIKENIDDVVKRDNLKNKQCEEHGIRIFYFSDVDEKYEYPYKIYRDFNIMLNDIINENK